MPVTINGSNTPTAGGVVYGDGTNYASTAAGTAGQALLSGGSSVPTWGTPAGGLNFISSQTVSTAVASVDFTSGISATYDDYIVYFSNVSPATNNAGMYLRLYKAGAFLTTLYTQALNSVLSPAVIATSNNTTFIPLTNTSLSSSVGVTAGSCTFTQMNNTNGYRPTVFGNTYSSHGTGVSNMVTMFGGSVSTAGATTGFQFYMSTGNIANGTFTLYGIAKS